MITVLIVEDLVILRDSLATAIGLQPDMDVVGALSDATQALEQVKRLQPSLVLMDVCTEHDASGIVATRKIKECPETAQTRVIVMTGLPDITFVQQARDACADGFVYKNVSTQDLLAIIRSTMEGYSTFPHGGKSLTLSGEPLTSEEMEILRLICQTKTRKEIAQQLYLSEGTVKRRISEILAKTGYDNALKLAVHAVADGYIAPRIGPEE